MKTALGTAYLNGNSWNSLDYFEKATVLVVDDSGYPEGLSGDDIPISARLMALADVYDVLISRRVYKEGMQHGKAVEIIMQGEASRFDPDVVDAFVKVKDEFRAIAQRIFEHLGRWAPAPAERGLPA